MTTSIAAHEDLHTTIEEALRRRFAERTASAAAYGDEFASLWRLAGEHILGGKLIRPRLLLDVYRALTASADESRSIAIAVEIAADVELLHYAFLLHDDVIDGDLIRRHRPNLIGAILGQRPSVPEPDGHALHWARTGALLMGDLLLSSAVLGFARANVSPHTRARLLDLLEHAIVETVAGEHTDVGLSDGMIAPDLRTILAMTAYKTATYSFALPLRAAAILADVDPSIERDLKAVGHHLGLAYQLQDDHLSVFGEPGEHGKDPFADLREGKETAIIAYARMTSAWSSIEPRFGRAGLLQEDAAQIRDRLVECGAESYARSLVDEHLAAARSVLDASAGDSAIPDPVRSAISVITEHIEGRRQ